MDLAPWSWSLDGLKERWEIICLLVRLHALVVAVVLTIVKC